MTTFDNTCLPFSRLAIAQQHASMHMTTGRTSHAHTAQAKFNPFPTAKISRFDETAKACLHNFACACACSTSFTPRHKYRGGKGQSIHVRSFVKQCSDVTM